MSTILKALRRLEEEKASAETGRPLREQVAARTPMPSGGGGRRWLAAVAAVVLSAGAGGALIWWMFGSERTEPQTVARVESPGASEPVAPPPVARRLATPAEPVESPGDAFASDVETVPRPAQQPRLADSRPVEPRKPPAAGARRPVHDTTAAARAREAARLEGVKAENRAELETLIAERRAAATAAAVSEPAPAPDAAPSSEPAPRAAAPVPKPEPAPAPAPVGEPAPEPAREVASMKPAPEPAPKAAPAPPPEPRAAAPAPAPPPDVLVEKTQWHPVSDRRIAWLRVGGEEREVVEGDVIEGMLVDEIQPSGVVFDHDGAEVRRGIGER